MTDMTNPDELRKLAVPGRTLNIVEGDQVFIVVKRDIDAAADAWERVEVELGLTSEMGARLNADSLAYEARIEELEGELRECRMYVQWDVDHQSEQRMEAVARANAIDDALAGKQSDLTLPRA